MGAFNALSSNLPLAAANLLDELGLGPKRVEGASKELQDEIINRTEQSFDDYSDAGSEYPKGGCGC